MSKNATIGMIVKAAVGVPDEHGEVAAKIMSLLAHDCPKAADWHQQFRDLLEGRSQIVSMPLLRDDDLKLVIEPQDFDWDAFAKRSDVCLWEGFQRFIREVQGKPVQARSVAIGRSVLSRNAKDAAIRGVLPSKHTLQLHEFVLAVMNGGAEKDGLWHLAYVEIDGQVCVVDGGWDAGRGQWLFVDWKLDDDEWSAGYRVLFRDSRVTQAV